MKTFENMPVLQAFRKWDRHLLLNHPRLWALRLPWLVVYLVLGNALALLVCSLVPLKIDQVDQFHVWLWVAVVVEILLFALWARAADRFSPHKALERTSPVNGLVEVAVFMLCVVVFLSPVVLGSFVLEHRFVELILATPIEADRIEVKSLEYNAVFPEELVERYTNLDYETYVEYSEANGRHVWMNYLIRSKINSFHKVAIGQDEDWQTFLIGMMLILHLGVVLFISRHVSHDVLIKTFLYCGAACILLGLLEIGGAIAASINFPDSLWIQTDYFITYTRIILFILSFGVIFFSLRVFWQKRYRTFTAMNITLLPYVILCLQFLILDTLDERHPLTNYVFYFTDLPSEWIGDFWGLPFRILAFCTPIFILWAFIPIKAMYTHLLALPEG